MKRKFIRASKGQEGVSSGGAQQGIHSTELQINTLFINHRVHSFVILFSLSSFDNVCFAFCILERLTWSFPGRGALQCKFLLWLPGNLLRFRQAKSECPRCYQYDNKKQMIEQNQKKRKSLLITCIPLRSQEKARVFLYKKL